MMNVCTDNSNGELQWLTIHDIAQRTQFSERTIRRMCERGDIRSVRFGKHYRIMPDAWNEYIARHSSEVSSKGG